MKFDPNIMYGEWKIIDRANDRITPKGIKIPYWKCQCSCDNKTIKEVSQYSLMSGTSKSCGCYKVGKYNKKINKYIDNVDCYIGYDGSNNKFYVDKDNFYLIKDYYWSVDTHGYVKTVSKNKKIYLHRIIMGCAQNDGKIVDHINGQRNDCRKTNLRFVDYHQNRMNQSIRSDNKTGVTGVYFNSKSNKWESYITINNKKINLGKYKLKNDAIQVRKDAEEKLFGEFNRQQEFLLGGNLNG